LPSNLLYKDLVFKGYLPEERKNKEVEFIAFKKFYQRIYKETGCKYNTNN